MNWLVWLSAALMLALIAVLWLMRLKPGEAPAAVETALGGAYTNRDELCKAIGMEFHHAVTLDGEIIHNGEWPPVVFSTSPKGGLMNITRAAARRAKRPELDRAGGCPGCGGQRPAPQAQPPGAPATPDAREARRSPAVPERAGSSAPASARPEPPAAAPADQGGAVPQKVARALSSSAGAAS